jgi:hypothetical protein
MMKKMKKKKEKDETGGGQSWRRWTGSSERDVGRSAHEEDHPDGYGTSQEEGSTDRQ